ncbi:hypothetical protein [Streptomyces sp. NPDC093600]|uniref:hypothetical protein n=1 Tax=Streptomyces sp. NPDC093600 TaxID=3366047 RepID=UPI00382E1ADC
MSHQTVANILAGRRVPRWLKVEALVDALLTLGRRETSLSEIDRFRSLWEAINVPAVEQPESPPEPLPLPAPEATQAVEVGVLARPALGQAGPSTADDEPREWQVLMDAPAGEGSSLRTTIVAAGWNGPEMFNVSFLPGIFRVELNLRHPMGNEIWKVMDGEDEQAATTLALLLISWARMEDEMPSGRAMERIRTARMDWSRYARLFIEDLSDT